MWGCGDAPPGWMFRVASGPAVGGGHVGRCRALGAVLRETLPVTFVLDRDGLIWREDLRRQGFDVLDSGDSFERCWWGGVLTDSYDLEENELARLRALPCPFVAVVDTVTPVRGCDLVINSAPGLEGDRLDGVPALLGSRYALIDRRFRSQGRAQASSGTTKIVVSFGLLDADDYCGKTLEAIGAMHSDVQLDVVVLIGRQCPQLDGLRERAARSKHKVEVRVDEFDMAGVLASADVVVGAGGVSLLERMAMGIPSLSIAVAENQKSIVRGASAAGATQAVPAEATANSGAYADIIQAFVENAPLLVEMAQRARALVDGRGVERVAEVLIDLARSGLQNHSHRWNA